MGITALEQGKSDDYAIVVGIDKYPLLKSLDGAVYDAERFVDWLKSSKGGNLQDDRVTTILSRDYDAPLDPMDTRPITNDIYRVYRSLNTEAKARADKTKPIARRLYLFFSGHGFGPDDFEEACLFMANASTDALGEHIPGVQLANFFVRSGHFSEVVLLMDCCRERMLSAPFRGIPMVDPSPGAGLGTLSFFGLAAPWGLVAREKPLPPDDHPKGVFTTALLEGLGGLAVNAAGQITDKSLTGHVFAAMKRMLGDAYVDPKLRCDARGDIVFVDGVSKADARSTVTISIGVERGSVKLLGGNLQTLDERAAGGGEWKLELSQGLYLLREASGEDKNLIVDGPEVHLEF